MNGKTLQRTPDLDQIEWVYADTFSGTSSGAVIAQQNLGGAGRFVEIMQGRALTTANINLTTDFAAGAGKRKVAFVSAAGSFSDPNTFRRRDSAGLSTVSVTTTTNTLRYLAIKGKKKYLTSVDLQNQNGLRRFDISNSPALTTLVVVNCSGIETISTSGCKNLTTLSLQSMTGLKNVMIDEACRSKLAALYLSGNTLIEDFNFRGMTSLSTVDVQSMTSLRRLDLIDTIATSFSASSLSALVYVRCPATLETFYVNAPVLTSVDLSSCVNLRYVEFNGCPLLSSLSMPTGWAGTSKAKLYITNCNFNAAALVSILDNLGEFSGYKSYVDVSGNPGSADASVQTAATNAGNRGWYVYTGA